MKYTQVAADAFQKLQLNAGVLLVDFDPLNPPNTEEEIEAMRANIFAATGGGVSFTAAPEYSDYGEDIDNVPANTKELKKQDNVAVTMSGTAKTVDTATAKAYIGAADVDNATGKITPRADLLDSDFQDIWWVGDYSDVNTGEEAGFIAIKLINALNTSGFSMQSNDNGKGDFAFEFTGHFSLADITVVPYELWIRDDTEESGDNAYLSALSIGSLTLTPAFSQRVFEYEATTSNASNSITATPADSAAQVTITLNEEELSGTSATWETGENTLVVTVVNGEARQAYTVTVTKGE